MEIIIISILTYLAVGLLALALLDITTGRIRKGLKTASIDAQSQLATSGTYVGSKGALILTIVALWLFWVAAIYAALRGEKNGEKRQRTHRKD